MNGRTASHKASRKEAFLLACAIILTAGAVTGCGTSSPRFRSSPGGSKSADQDVDETRFATKIKADEAKEDDHRLNVDEIRKHLEPRNRPSTRYTNLTPAGLNRDRLLLDVVSYLGVPYEHGGQSKEGVDCSGFTSLVYESAAKRSLPRSVEGQYQAGREVEAKDLEFGDLVFFNTTGRSPSHVGIYIEDGIFAHASVTRGVTLSSLESTYYKDRFVGARRIVGPVATPP